MRRRIAIATVSAMLAVSSFSGLASAAQSQVADSFEVGTTFSVSGIPASIAYTEGGGPVYGVSDVVKITASISTNADLEIRLSGSDFTSAGAAPDLPESVREVQVSIGDTDRYDLWSDNGGTWHKETGATATTGFYAFGNAAAHLDGADPVVWGIAPLASHNAVFDLRVNLPQNVAPDAYSGSMTFDFTSLAP